MENLTFRPACLEDADPAGALITETLYGFGVYQTGLGSSLRAAQALSAYFRLPGNRFSHEFTYMAYAGGELVGLLLVFPGKIFERVNRKATLQMPRVYSPGEILEYYRRVLILRDEEEVDRDEYYIAHLAVCTAFRRQGVGRTLLTFAQGQAQEEGIHKLSLLVECENQGAIALYEQFSFSTVKTYSHPHQIPLTGSPGYVKMIKEV